MKYLLYLIMSSQLVFSQSNDTRISFNGGLGLADDGHVWPFYVVYSIGCNTTSTDGQLYLFRFSIGSITATPDEDPETYSYKQFAILKGIQKEAKYAKAFVACGLGLAIHEHLHSSKSYSATKFGLAYEAGASIIPSADIGIGFKIMGQITTSNWSDHGIYLSIDLGNIRKK